MMVNEVEEELSTDTDFPPANVLLSSRRSPVPTVEPVEYAGVVHPYTAPLEAIVARCITFFDDEAKEDLLFNEGISLNTLYAAKRSKSFSGRRVSKKDKPAPPKLGEEGGIGAASAAVSTDEAVKLVDEVIKGARSLESARKLLKPQSQPLKLEFEWLLARHSGLPLDLFTGHRWVTDPIHLWHLFLKDKAGRDKDVAVKALLYWIEDQQQGLPPGLEELTDAVEEVASTINDIDIKSRLLDAIKDYVNHSATPNPNSLKEIYPYVNIGHEKSELDYPLWQLPSAEAALQLSLLDADMLAMIKLEDLRIQTKASSKGERLQNLLASCIEYNNNLTISLVGKILEEQTPELRANRLDTILEVGKHLLAHNNFQSLFALYGVFRHASISRLKRTLNNLSRSGQKVFASLELIVAPDRNHDSYRQRLRGRQGFCIPYIGILFKDLTNASTAMKTDSGEIIFEKVRKISNLLLRFRHEVARAKAYGHVNTMNGEWHGSMLAACNHVQTEKELYELSLKLEPREVGSLDIRSHSDESSRGQGRRRRNSLSQLTSKPRPTRKQAVDINTLSTKESVTSPPQEYTSPESTSLSRIQRTSRHSSPDPPLPVLPESPHSGTSSPLMEHSENVSTLSTIGLRNRGRQLILGLQLSSSDQETVNHLSLLLDEYNLRLSAQTRTPSSPVSLSPPTIPSILPFSPLPSTIPSIVVDESHTIPSAIPSIITGSHNRDNSVEVKRALRRSESEPTSVIMLNKNQDGSNIDWELDFGGTAV